MPARSRRGGQHLTLKAQRPATRRKSSYALPDTSGKWSFANATGTLNLKGVLHIVLGKRSAAMKSVTFIRPAKGNGQVTVKLAGQAIGAFTVKVSNTPIAGPGSSPTASGVTPTSSSGVGIALTPSGSMERPAESSFSVNGGPELKLFDIDTCQLEQAATPNGGLDLRTARGVASTPGRSLSLSAVDPQQPFGAVVAG